MDNLTAGNPVAHRVRVYYTGSDTLIEGEPLCYSFKTTRNWFGGSVSDAGVVTASEYVAEGSHNASKYMCVESPFRASITSMDSVAGSNVITGDGTDFANFHVGMAVSIASASDANADGNYVITAVGALGVTITLDMTAAEAAAVTTQADVTVQIDNISAPAGVVAKGGWCGKAGPRVIDVYVPNGAVVPVRCDQNCVLGRTILAIHTNEQHLTAPHQTYALPIAVAWETVDRGTTAGLVLAKLDTRLFIYQTGDVGTLLVDDKDTTSNITANLIDVSTSQTGGRFTALHVKSTLTAGAGSDHYGAAIYAHTIVSSAPAVTQVASVSARLEVTAGTPTEYLTALKATVKETGATMTSVGIVSCLNLALQVTNDCTANNLVWIYLEDNSTQKPDQFIHSGYLASLPAVAVTGTITITNGTPCDYLMKVRCHAEGGTKQYYIPLIAGRTTG